MTICRRPPSSCCTARALRRRTTPTSHVAPPHMGSPRSPSTIAGTAEAVGLLGEAALMLVHARGDEVVPYTISEELYERASEPKRLLLLEDGHHRSAQHDAEIQGETLRWLARVL